MPSRLPRHWQVALFKRFEAIYGNLFVDRFKTQEDYEAAMQEWAEALVVLSGEQIKRGIEKCRVVKTFPPSIAEFMTLAREEMGYQGAAYRFYRPALPKPFDRDRALGELAKMRACLS